MAWLSLAVAGLASITEEGQSSDTIRHAKLSNTKPEPEPEPEPEQSQRQTEPEPATETARETRRPTTTRAGEEPKKGRLAFSPRPSPAASNPVWIG